ncbi:type I polyketide synthase [Pseudonocardia endophytica]|uniref:Acyl transferase domain-containing protein n=1 Tax=Pseudonocardia endophytica TaxID=401976 RepID=A0A4R1HR20_PSEEN|nr:type I polyketide synthase [Pseudonocardia endophytica]TCK22209.1 acyl transferase domain-containing protein [Pseudonocardia endophytica]
MTTDSSASTTPIDEPLAVVGLSCRLPGAADPHAYWELLATGRDAVGPAPDWRGERGRGGYLDGIELFDAAFFDVPAQEADVMDPQQRLVLELVWEALEDARIVPATLRDSDTAVVVGAMSDDYAHVVRAAAEPAGPFTMTGTGRAFLANRTSYALGLRGPSMTVDTGQSSSLVAVHQAAAALRRGECGTAVVGGVQLNLSPETESAMDALGVLSPSGRCWTFDERADGIARGEGGGFVVLKPLSRARADGDRVYCTLLGSAVNSGGHGAGLTAPNESAQFDVVTAAWAHAGVRGADLRYVELHGTGTRLGDPIEAAALGRALDGAPSGRPLDVGSVKTSIGHLEGAAGIAGLIKVALSLHHRTLPATPHHERPNPDIDWAAGTLRMRTADGRWPGPDGDLVAGVSSFGLGGTNCHAVLGEGLPAHAADPSGAMPAGVPRPLVLSGATPAALSAQAGRLADHLGADGPGGADPDALGLSLATTRTAFAHRAAVLARPGEPLGDRLRALAAGDTAGDDGVVTGTARQGVLAHLIPGQGGQRAGMGRELHAAFPAFATAFDDACAAVDGPLGESLRDVVWGSSDEWVDRLEYGQPALFAVEVALYRLFESWGVMPDLLIGHSQGEITAAHLTGVLSLEDAAAFVVERGRLIGSLPPGGSMVAVQATEDELLPVLAEHPGAELAAINSERSVVVSGVSEAVGAVADRFRAMDRRVRALRISRAGHCALMEPIREPLHAAARRLTWNAPTGPTIVSAVTGVPATVEQLTSPRRWAEHLVETVRFGDAVATARSLGATTFLELGPGHGLTTMAAETAPGGTLAAPLGDTDEPASATTALATLHVTGTGVDWPAVFGGAGRVDLPTYAFRRRRYWAGDRLAPPAEPSRPDTPAARPPADEGSARDLVRATVDELLGREDTRSGGDTPFRELGLDSRGAVALVGRLAERTGLTLPVSLVFDHPTPDLLAAHVAALVGPSADPPVAPAPVAPAPVAPAPEAAVAEQRADTDTELGADTAGPDDIAVVAMACRYPGGVDSPAALWRLVDSGTDATGPFPTDRGWDLDGIDTAARRGGFLDEATAFDARFFGISPREAAGMDPQQRVLLEVASEAFERAGLDRDTLRGSDTGVYVGAMAQDYGPRLDEPSEAGGHRITGSTTSVASGRISYVLGLVGPAVTVDTACSSSLVGVHLAAQALRAGECSTALAGGVAVMSTPGLFVDFSRSGGLSPDGRCKAFSDDADGTAWAEGAGVLVLQRLADARAAGRTVHAVIRGTATNQDGASNGLTAPSGAAQRAVIRAALDRAGLRPGDVDAVEAHGTGTPLGDPIEAQALADVYGADRPAGPLALGSLKSNIGHAQAAAGVGGVIKMIESMRAGRLPATLHAERPSGHVDWPTSGLELLTGARDWDTGRVRRAAVSSFGISGTNAHVIVEEPPARTAGPEPADEGPVVWRVSAPTVDGLRRTAARLAEHLSRDDARPADVARTLAERTAFARRAAVVGASGDDLRAGLETLAAGTPVPPSAGRYHAPTVLRGSAAATHDPVFVFPGQGSQWSGMGRELLETSPVFAGSVDACARALAPHVDWDLHDALRGDAPDRVDVLQPALFAVMVSLAALWRAEGVRPGAVVGHSQGEIAAAHVAGALSLEDAAAVVALRSKAIREIAGDGGMVALRVGDERARELLAPFAPRIELAVVNGPGSTSVAGEAAALTEFLAACEAAGVDARRIDVDYASHTQAVERIRDSVTASLATVAPRTTDVPLYSTLTGGRIDTSTMDAGYWYANLRNTVEFSTAVRAMAADGHRTFVESSPHPVLVHGIAELAGDDGCTVVGSIRRDAGGLGQLRTALAALHVAGARVEAPAAGRRIDLPGYAFDRARHWLTATPQAAARRGPHPFVDGVLETRDATIAHGTVDPQAHPWLLDHGVRDTALLPGTAFVDVLVAVGRELDLPRVAEMVLTEPLETDGGPAGLRVTAARADEAGHRAVTVESTRPGAGWVRHATATLAPADAALPGTVPAVGAAERPDRDGTVDLTGAYERLAGAGYRYGPAFRGLRALWRDPDDDRTLVADVELPVPDGAGAGWTIHPALLDAALHPALVAGDGRLAVPFGWTDVAVHDAAAGATAVRVRVRVDGDTVSALVTDPGGRPVARVGGLRMQAVAPAGRPELLVHSTRQVDAPAAPVDWAWFDEVGDGPAPAVVALAVRDGDGDGDGDTAGTGGVPAAVTGRTAEALRLLQEALGDPRLARSTIAVVTRGAAAPAGRETLAGLSEAAVAGLARSAATENPGRVRLVDLDDTPASAAALDSALACGEPELLVRDGLLRVPHLRPADDDLLAVPQDAPAWRLDVTRKGSLDDAALVPHPEAVAPLGDHEVRIAVRAAGLNFRDVAVGTGLVRSELTMGSEGAGVVTGTGAGVEGLAVGDRVFGVFERSLGPVAVADARTVRPIPPGWSFSRAAAVPIVYVTAYQCIVEIARLSRGESMLIHTATGGVGVAAIQIARHLGAEVFATASPAKQDMLRAMGIDDDHIASSRTLEFEEHFRSTTGGRGIDVVLNSLAGESIDASLRLLAPGGRFAEMGKTDIRDRADVVAQHPGVHYAAYNILGEEPERIGEVLDELIALFGAGDLHELPLTVSDVRRGHTALRTLRRATHRGKLVATMPRTYDPSGTTLITGGTGELGGLVARHLVTRHGARNLLLVGRRGPDAPGAAELVAELEALGATVTVTACDAADRDALAPLVAEHRPTAVVHAAGVLADGLVERMSADQLAEALRPKVDAAWNLHELTSGTDLSAFVLFSSAAGVLGDAGQGNYAAANTFLDALARHRRSAGLAATSVAWGLWEQRSGMTAHLTDGDVERLRRAGIAPLPTTDALALLDAALAGDDAVYVPMMVDADGLARNPRRSHLLSELAGEAPETEPATEPETEPATEPETEPATEPETEPATEPETEPATEPETEPERSRREPAAPPASADPAVDGLELVLRHAAEVLGVDDADGIGPDDAFRDLGFDSLLGLDLRNRLNAEVGGLDLPAEAVMTHPTPRELAALIAPVPAAPAAPAHEPDGADTGRWLDVVRETTADVLGLGDAAEIGPDEPFRDLGVDSLLGLDLRNRLNAAVDDLSLPAEAVIEHRTPEALATFMHDRLAAV